MKCTVLLKISFETRNVPLPSGALFAEPLPSDTSFEFETNMENFDQDLQDQLSKYNSEDCRVVHYDVYMKLEEGGEMQPPFEIPPLTPERIAYLRGILDKIANRNKDFEIE